MKQFRLLAGVFLMTSFVMTSCTDDEAMIESDQPTPRKISLSGEITQVYRTRANDAGFCNGDAVGIYIVDYEGETAGKLLDEGNRADNVKYTFDEAAYKWIPVRDVYWKDTRTHIDIYGYYPFSTPDNVASYFFEVQKDQSTAAESGKIGGYEASDFLWGKAENAAPTDKAIKIGFRHMMASARVTLVEGTGFSEGEWAGTEKQVLFLNTIRKATIDLATGTVTPTGDIPSTGTIPYNHENDFRAIIVPQEVAAGTPLVSITVGGTPYLFKKDEAFTYVPSKQHNFTMTVNKREAHGGYEFVLSSESITAWENDNVSHDATAREYIVIDVAEAGTLEECIIAAGKDVSKIKNLKVTGQINFNDFIVMRDKMSLLGALNLKEVVIACVGYRDDEIPAYAFERKETLTSLVLPDKLKYISENAFSGCNGLSGSLMIPEGVEEIGVAAFDGCVNLTGSLSLPSTLKRIGGYAFQNCNFMCELILPEGLEEIGYDAFMRCKNLYGELRLPDGLKLLGEWAFWSCENLTGSLTIPQGVTKIPDYCFGSCSKLNGTLTLHDGITSIGENAFEYTGLKGELQLPKDLEAISSNAFSGCDFSGTLVLPKGLRTIGNNSFSGNWRLMGVLEIPENVISIGAKAFYGCRSIEGVIFPNDLEVLGTGAFENCFGIGRIVCKGIMPAHVMEGAFDGVAKDNFTLEVPESAVQQYQTTAGWKDFKRISAYRNLVCRPSMATAINTSVTRNLVLNAESEWSVESQPDWVTLDKTNGTGKTELKLTFSEMPKSSQTREGEIVFKLKDQDYRTKCAVTQYNYEYEEDEIVTLQRATQGKGVNLVFLGDGYNAKDISEGAYMKDIKEAVEYYFNIEPYKSYRDYFNVYTGIAVSAESGVGGVNTIIYNRFNTTAIGGVSLGGRNNESDEKMILEYACKAPTVSEKNIGETLIVMIPNTSDYGGICYMYDDGSAIAYCPKSDYGYPLDFRGVLQHEAGGHGFGKLGDEYIYRNAFVYDVYIAEIKAAKAKGWYDNLSVSGIMSEVSWSHLLFHDKYKQIVDIFEGGYKFSRGVYRSEQNSCMNNNIPYYSTISREAIVKRIMKIAGETYSFEDFVAKDVTDASTTEIAVRSAVPEYISRPAMRQSAPVMRGKRPKLND